MRWNIPLIPLSVTIERRPSGPIRPRATLRSLMLVVLGLAVYLTAVTIPARKERYRRADRTFREQIALLERTAVEDRAVEERNRTLFDKDIACAEAEECAVAKWPEASDQARSHREIAALWIAAARKVPLGMADASGRRARAIEQWVATLRAERAAAEGSITRFERLAAGIRDMPTLPEWTKLKIADRIAEIETRLGEELRAQTDRAIMAAGSQL